ncbi:MAG: NigD-like C-terminal domain-containing protein [Melioribacteraceae bacterium]|nr:NigD-like C-terminal domain-containing protein [Melioribacteraceae bacterium]
MKIIYKIAVLFLGVVLLSCTENHDPIGPDHQALILNKSFDSVTVHLDYGKDILINNYAILKFEGVESDSRCPIDAICIWAGNGEVNMVISTDRDKKRFKLNTLLEPRKFVFDDFVIELKALNPAPRSDRPIKPQDYSVDLIIKPAANSSSTSIPVKLIEGNDTDFIKRDMLNVNSLALLRDDLKFNVSYSGGCKDHTIELYAFKGIQKSNPAQVTLILSHNANGDMCEAYLTKTVSFDLAALKNYLKSVHGISDKVLLIIHDPSGRPIHNPVIEYNF